jgi:uncharacterized RDD family membrane protein YckC
MVLNDPFAGTATKSNLSQATASTSYALASPQDRLAAVVVDYLLLIPLMSLALAPLKRIFYVGQMLGDDFYFHFEMFFAVLVVLVVCVAYQTLFVFYKGATPGKMLLKIRVTSIWPGRRITLMEATIRSLIWWFEALLLFIPHLAVSGGHRRRPPHDRLADTIVVTHRWLAVSEPSVVETNFARGMMHVALICAAFLVTVNMIEVAREPKRDISFVATENAPVDCSVDDDQANPNSHIDSNTDADRSAEDNAKLLEAQLSLFAIGRLPSKCLEAQADRILNLNPDSGMAYLAKAFVFAEDQAKSDTYLDEVCLADRNSESCQFSHIVADWNDGDWKETSASLADLTPHGPEFIRLWAVRHFFKTRDYQRVVDLLETAPDARVYANFVLNHRFKSLWFLNRKQEARLVYQVHQQHLSVDDKLESTHWLCDQELHEGCEGLKSASCQSFLKLTAGREADILTTHGLAMTDIKAKMCQQGEQFNFQTSYFENFPDQAREFLKALEMASQQNLQEARDVMQELAESEDINPVTAEARMTLVRWAQTREDLASVYDIWQKQDPFQMGWLDVGQELMNRYAALGASDVSFDVGMMLYGANDTSPQFLRRLADISTHSQHLQAAHDILRTLSDESHPQPQRQPASEESP